MGRLVVGRILPANAEAVDVIVHQCGNGVSRGDVRREDVQMGGVARIPENDLFAPVTKEVGLQTGRGLGPVARG